MPDNRCPQTVTTGSGNDMIVIGASASIASIDGGAGGDFHHAGASHSGVDRSS